MLVKNVIICGIFWDVVFKNFLICIIVLLIVVVLVVNVKLLICCLIKDLDFVLGLLKFDVRLFMLWLNVNMIKWVEDEEIWIVFIIVLRNVICLLKLFLVVLLDIFIVIMILSGFVYIIEKKYVN